MPKKEEFKVKKEGISNLNYDFPTKRGLKIKMSEKQIQVDLVVFHSINLFVTTVGFEPTRPYEHHPLKMASLPFLHVAENK